MKTFSLAVLLLAATISVVTSQQTQKITLAANACSGIIFSNLPNKFSYDAKLASVNLGTCNASQLRISKLYLQDTCASTRDNTISTDAYKSITCSIVSDSSPSSCQTVFSKGGSGNLVNDNSTSIGASFDSSNVCADVETGYIFLQSTCAQPIEATITVTTGSYSGGPCLTVGGHTLSGVAIAIIVVAAVVAVFLAIFLISCCCCGRRCC